MSQTDILSNSGSQPPRANLTIQQSTEKPDVDSHRGTLTDSVSGRFGSSVGGYEIQAELGRGGMGIVFRAFDPDLKRSVALKILSSGASASVDELIRFRGEAELVAKLQHPNIVQIFEIGQHENMPFLALEYVDGGTLAKQIAGQPQPPRQAAEWVEVLARAVHVAHLEGVVHRDLKPANVLLTKTGILKVTDFGLAKNLESSVGLSHDGQLMGTPSYMAPEQAAGNLKLIGPRTDVYALGAILYELLTGRPPFRGATILDTLEQVRQVEPASPSRLVPKLPRELCTICLKCLEKSPERRYGTALDLGEDLRRWIDGERIKARPIPFWKRTARAVRRRPYLAAQVIIAVLVIGLIALGVGLYRESQLHARIEEQSRETKEKERIIERNRSDLLRRSGDALDGILTKLTNHPKISKLNDLEPLHEELFQFYDRLFKDSLTADSLGAAELKKWGEVFSKLGSLSKRSGKKEEARNAFGRAIEYGRKWKDLAPEDLECAVHLAEVLIESADVSFRYLKDRALAKTHLEEARSLLTSVPRAFPKHPGVRNKLAETHHLMGEILSEEKKFEGAIQEYVRAIEIRTEIRKTEKNEQFNRDLARDYGYLGDTQLEYGLFSEADAAYWKSHGLRGGNLSEEEVSKRLTSEEKFQLARSWQNLANFQFEQRFFDSAIGYNNKSLSLREELYRIDKANKELSSDLAESYRWLAQVYLLKAGENSVERDELLREARDKIGKARAQYERLYESDEKTLAYQRGLAEVRLLAARYELVSAKAADAPAALGNAGRELSNAKTILQFNLKTSEKDGDLYYLLACAEALEAEIGQDSASANRRESAVTNLENAGRNDLHTHPKTIQQDRALKSLKDDPKFKAWFGAYSKSYLERRGAKMFAPN